MYLINTVLPDMCYRYKDNAILSILLQKKKPNTNHL